MTVVDRMDIPFHPLPGELGTGMAVLQRTTALLADPDPYYSCSWRLQMLKFSNSVSILSGGVNLFLKGPFLSAAVDRFPRGVR